MKDKIKERLKRIMIESIKERLKRRIKKNESLLRKIKEWTKSDKSS